MVGCGKNGEVGQWFSTGRDFQVCQRAQQREDIRRGGIAVFTQENKRQN